MHATAARRPLIVFAVLALVLALRVLHLGSAMQSPLSYQPGPDEDYYRRFGEAVAAGHGEDSAEFTFMDPGYGYLLGFIFKFLGVNVAAVYFLQALLDTATAYAILTIGRMIGRPRAGLYGALLYAATSTALIFCAALLKEICVAAFVTWWVAAALAVSRSERRLAWFAFGAFCGVGVALRSTLVVLGLLALVLPGIAGKRPAWGLKAVLVAAGMALAMAPWSVRNYRAFGGLSPLPHNGGIVLHQVYNAENPASAIWIPGFVNYSHPSEIWRGYAAEADMRTGRELSPSSVDAYWRGEAFAYLREHPGAVAADVARKGLMFLSDTEVPNNRAAAEERMFSPVLALLPPPAAWLLAMGLSGLVWFGVGDRRWPLLAAPIAVAWATFAVFWAEDRFRFHALPVLALFSGVWLEGIMISLWRWRERRQLHGAPQLLETPKLSETPQLCERPRLHETPQLCEGPHFRDERRARGRQSAAFGASAVLIFAASLLLGRQFPPPPIRWDNVVWGYINMGKFVAARALAERIAVEQPDNGPIFEALGYLAAADQHHGEAVTDFEHAVALRPRSYVAHYNLAKAYLALGQRVKAADAARTALRLNPSSDAQALLTEIEAAPQP